MKTIQELAAAAAVTDTSTSQISETQGKQWANKVIQFGESLCRFDQIAIMNDWMVGKGDKTVTLAITTASLDFDVAQPAEGDLRDNTELTNLDTVDLTIGSTSWKHGMTSIAKQILLTSRIDLIAQARYAIAKEFAKILDVSIATSLQSTTVAQVLWGGDATGVDSLAAGDVLTTDLFANAMAEIEQYDFKPAAYYMGVNQLKALRKDPQFNNASEYGKDAVVMKGEVGNYLGVKIITTTNTAMAYAGSATDINETPTAWAVAGNCNIMVGTDMAGSKIAVAVGWKEKPHVGYEYEQKRAIHRLYLDECYITAIVQPKAVCLVKVANV